MKKHLQLLTLFISSFMFSQGFIETVISTGFQEANGIALDVSGNIYVTDAQANGVFRIDNSGQNKTQIGGTYNQLNSIAIDKNDKFFIGSTYGYGIKTMDKNGTTGAVLGASEMFFTVSISDDSTLFGGTSGAVMKVLKDGTGTPIPVVSNLSYVKSISNDANGNIYYTNFYGTSIKRANSTGANSTDFVTGIGYGTPIHISKAGNLYFSDNTGTYIIKDVKNAPDLSDGEKISNTVAKAIITDDAENIYIASGKNIIKLKDSGIPAEKTYPNKVKKLGYYGSSLVPYYHVDRNASLWKNKLYYLGGTPNGEINLVVTDGTSTGTKILKKITTNAKRISEFKTTDKWLYFVVFTASGTSGDEELWRTDGTEANTTKVDQGTDLWISANYDDNPYNKKYYTTSEINDEFYYTKEIFGDYTNSGIYKIASTSTTPVFVSRGDTKPGKSRILNNKLYFIDQGTAALCMYNGSTKQVLLTYNYQNGNTIDDIVAISANKVYFKGTVNTNVKGIYSVNSQNQIVNENFMYSNPSFLFSSYADGKYNQYGSFVEILDSDGSVKRGLFMVTDNGFKLIKDTKGLKINNFEVDDKYLYVIYTDNNFLIYIDKYTATGEFISKVTIPKTGNYMREWASIMYKGSYYFQHYGNFDEELWRTDGIQENTALAINIDTGNYASSSPADFFTINDNLYFFANVGGIRYLMELNGDFTFNNKANDNSWKNVANWKSEMVPNSEDVVTIPTNLNPLIDGNAYAKTLTVNNALEIKNTGNLNVFENLALNNKVNIDGGKLTLKNQASISNGSSTNYIITKGTGIVNIENLDNARGSVALPIGTATNYNPITISNTGTSDTFSVKVSDGIANTTNGAVNSTWDISEATAGGSNVNISLGWNQSQENATFDKTAAKVGHYLNGTWNEEITGTVSGTNPFTISATGITSFSPFSVMNFAPLATNDLAKSKVSVYPNPFNDNLNIITQENGVVHFYDMSGKLISTSLLMKGSNALNKSSLNKGIYLYQVKSKDGSVISSGKVIKK